MNASYLCIGQLRLEWLSEVERLPQKNQSVAALGSEVKLAAGVGTDAIKIARLGKPVHLIGRIGRDAVGDFILNMLRHEGVNTTFVRRTVNCKSHYRQLLQAADGDLIEVMNQSEGCRLTVDDVLAAQALFVEAERLVLDNSLEPAVLQTALSLAEKYMVDVRYADVSEAGLIFNKWSAEFPATPI